MLFQSLYCTPLQSSSVHCGFPRASWAFSSCTLIPFLANFCLPLAIVVDFRLNIAPPQLFVVILGQGQF